MRDENFGFFCERTYVDVFAISNKRSAFCACAYSISHLFSCRAAHKEKDGLKQHEMYAIMLFKNPQQIYRGRGEVPLCQIPDVGQD